MYKILIVDDEQYTLDGLVDLLDWNTLDILEPITANNVREAKNLLLKQSVDIILCDIEMPHGTGLELTHWIRENLTDISVILVTCHEEFAYAQEALALKVTDYIVKPVIKDQLEKVLRSTIKSIKERRFSKRTEIFRNRLWRKVLIEQPELSQKDIEKEFRSNFSLYSRNDKFAIFLLKQMLMILSWLIFLTNSVIAGYLLKHNVHMLLLHVIKIESKLRWRNYLTPYLMK